MFGRTTFASLAVGATFTWPEGSGIYRKDDNAAAHPIRWPGWRIAFAAEAMVNPKDDAAS